MQAKLLFFSRLFLDHGASYPLGGRGGDPAGLVNPSLTAMERIPFDSDIIIYNRTKVRREEEAGFARGKKK